MTIRETELPGVGKKYTLETQSAGQVAIVLHRTGKREIYHFPPGANIPSEVIDLTAEEAQQVGGILSQTHFEAKQDSSTELVMKELTIEWIKVPDDHSFIGQSIRDLEVRKRTGATIIAILREGKSLINPDPAELLGLGDTLMVIGSLEQVTNFSGTFGFASTGKE